MQANNGYIKLHRKMLDNPVVCKDSDYFSVWCYLLLKASHAEIKVDFYGETKTLQTGQLITGSKAISTKLKIDESKVKRILKNYESERMIEQITYPRKGRIITILNWVEYQDNDRIDDRIVTEYSQKSDRIMTECETPKNKVLPMVSQGNNENVNEYRPNKEQKMTCKQEYINNNKKKNDRQAHTAAWAAAQGMSVEEFKNHIAELRR